MSTKTNFKRIALVAVTALGAGVLSVAPANATEIDAGDIAISTTVANTTAGIGVCVVSASASATVTTAATLVFTKAANGNTGYLKIESGPAVFTAASGALSSAQTKAVITASGATANLKASAVGAVRVVAYNDLDVAIESYAITVVAACAADAYSAANSFLQGTTSGATATSNVDVSGSLDKTNDIIYVSVALNDAYDNPLVTAGVITATVGAGAVVGLNAAGVGQTAVLGSNMGDFEARISQATAGVPATGTVTIQFNGVTVGTRTYTIRGLAKSITVNPASLNIGKAGVSAGSAGSGTLNATGAGYYEFQYKDSAGNVVTNSAGVSAGNNAASSLTGINTIVTEAWSVVMPTTTTTATTNFGKGQWTCASGKSGTATIVVAAKNSNLETITSNPFTATCGDVLDTWTVSMDKATYAPGEIATLTLTGKDVRGALINSFDAIGTVETSFGGLTAVTAPTTTDKFTSAAGVKRYQYAVGLSEGSFVGSFKITGATDTAAKTVQYKVANATGTVSNADVLKAIVSLIASINKQIAALQKALLRR
jgi:trimeric autotransporter adhesin